MKKVKILPPKLGKCLPEPEQKKSSIIVVLSQNEAAQRKRIRN